MRATLTRFGTIVTAAAALTAFAAPSAAHATTNCPVLTVADSSVVEGNSGTMMMHFNVTLSAATDHDVTFKSRAHEDVEYDRPATPGKDFLDEGIDVPHTIPAGATSTTIDVPVVGDKLIEGNEMFDVLVWSAHGAQIGSYGDVTVPGTIIDDDSAATGGTYPIHVSNTLPGEAKGFRTATFVITVETPSPKPFQVQFATKDGTASAGKDYVARAGKLTFAAGRTSHIVQVKVKDDRIHEGDETFSLVATAPAGYTVENSGIATIQDND
jgi:chitinase